MSSPTGQIDLDVPASGEAVRIVEVFADVVCPFTHVGLRRILAERERRGASRVAVRVRAWPLELVNGSPPGADLLVEEIEALRRQVVPDMFVGFTGAVAPQSTMAALELGCAAYARSLETGERVAVAMRNALFEDGQSIEDASFLESIAEAHGLDSDRSTGRSRVVADFEEGRARGVIGSPHFFVPGTDSGERGWFCPGLDISHTADGFTVRLATTEFDAFLDSCFEVSG